MADPTPYAARLRAALPSLAVQTLDHIGGGDNNIVFLVNGELIVRFALLPGGAQQLAHEAELLAAIAPLLSVAVPRPEILALDDPTPGRAFMTYRALPGEQLTSFQPPELLDAIARSIAAFLRELHAIRPADLPAALHIADPRDYWRDLDTRIQQRLIPLMGPQSARQTQQRFETFLAGPTPAGYGLIHGDLGSDHLLLDAATGRVTGVIDWGSAHIDDPAVDYAAISTAGDALFSKLLTIAPEIAAARERAAFYRSTFGLQAWLHALDHGTDDDRARFRQRYSL